MIFQHTWEKVLSEEKTQTRRLKKPAEWFYFDGATIEGGQHRVFYDPACIDNTKPVILNPRCVYGVGKTYAIQPGRGMKAVGRIQITNIRREDVREISFEDAMAEGFTCPLDFLEKWVAIQHDPCGFYFKDGYYHQWRGRVRNWEVGDGQSVMDCLMDRPAKRYQAWVLEFQLVK